MPMTPPPLNARVSAGPSPFLAACAVLELVLTVAAMPMYPAIAERAAPTRKPIDVTPPVFRGMSMKT